MRTPVSTPKLLAYCGCAALIVGSLGPWQSSLATSQAGIDGGGLYTLPLAVIAALLLIPRRTWLTATVGIGLLCLIVTVCNVFDVASATRQPIAVAAPSVEVGWGLWLATLGALALTAGAVLFRGEIAGWGARRFAQPGSRGGAASAWIRSHPATFGLLVLLGAGAALRTWLTLAWSPAFVGYSDTGIYFTGAVESVWSDPIRMVGYSMFLRAIHSVDPHLLTVILVQHAIGLGAAALLFFAVRRCGGPGWLGLAPAAVIALGGDELFLEHAALSDALFIALIAATLYATVRASQDRVWWAAVAGLCAGLAVWDRTVGLGLVAIVAAWLVLSRGRPTRQTVTVGAISLGVALVTVGAYAVWRSAAADLPGTLTANNAWNLYGRVAPWADCEEFPPPLSARGLCETTPASQRGYPSGEEYIYSPESPGQRLFGPPYLISSDPHAMERMQEWSEAAIRGQPLDYLNAVWLDTRRLFSPHQPSYGDLTADTLIAYLLYGPDLHSGRNEFVESWQTPLYPSDPPARHGDIAPFRTWEAATRIVNIWMGILLALCLVGPWVLSGRARAGMILFATTALMLIFFPIVSKGYDYRFVVPAYAPLVAAGALAAWGVAVKFKAWAAKSRDTSVEAILARHGEQRLDSGEFERHFGSLPADDED
jgi:hypothetical protein